MSNASYRTILRSSSIIGSAQVISLVARLAKIKFVALFLGPAGVGLVGLFASLIETASVMASLGLGTAGTRRIAAANAEEDARGVARARRAILVAGVLLALVGAGVFWIAGDWIERVALGGQAGSGEMTILAAGVGLLVLVAAQTAVLSGLRRIGDLARINIGAAVISALIGVFAVWKLGQAGLVVMVIAVPAVTFLLGLIAMLRIGVDGNAKTALAEIPDEWKNLFGIGIAFMLSGLVIAAGQLAARSIVQSELGTEALGYFQAAWAITMTYLGFVLAAMGTDYFPRLSAVIKDPEAATQLVNEQTDVALLLCGPILLASIGFAPWIIELLYSSEFAPSVAVLRWQLLGDILKIMSWPLGFVLLAAGAGGAYIATQSIGMAVFLGGIIVGLPIYGVEAAGLSFIALYAAILPANVLIARGRINFRWIAAVKWQALVLFLAATATLGIAHLSDVGGAICGFIFAIAFGILALVRLQDKAFEGTRAARIAGFGERIAGWITKR